MVEYDARARIATAPMVEHVARAQLSLPDVNQTNGEDGVTAGESLARE